MSDAKKLVARLTVRADMLAGQHIQMCYIVDHNRIKVLFWQSILMFQSIPLCFTVFVITNSVWQLRRIKAGVRVLTFGGCSNFPFNSTFTTSHILFFWAADWIGLKASSRDTSVTYIGQDGALSVVCSVLDYLMSFLNKVDAFSTVP